MKLASLKQGRDGELIVVSKDLTRAATVESIPTLQYALDNWEFVLERLEKTYQKLNQHTLEKAFPLHIEKLASPLPRAFQWLDGSSFLAHVKRVRKARGVDMPPSFLDDPLMYQGGSDSFVGPRDPIVVESEAFGIDCEAEMVVVTDDVPQGIKAHEVEPYVRLVGLVNDVSLRNLIPAELGKGFGFMASKPASAFSPVFVTPDELGPLWEDGKCHLPLVTKINGKELGHPNAGTDMQFSFFDLIAHAAKTRHLTAGTIIGSGTVANEDESVGCSCLAEKRVLEIIYQGEAKTSFLSFGDVVQIEMKSAEGQSIFGEIRQKVVPYQK